MWVGTNVRFCYTVFIKKKGDFLAMKRTFLFATIASILSINAYAVSATVTSKDYVDAADATKQDKLPSKNVTTTIDETEMDVPSIVLYPADGENAGNVGEIGFVSKEIADAKSEELQIDESGGDYSQTYSLYEGWLSSPSGKSGRNVGDYAVSGATLAYAMRILYNLKADRMLCVGWPDGVEHTDENCWLWEQ